MKCHKIRNIPLEVCTVEQKIAYNLALSWRDIILKEYKKALTPSKKGEYNEDAMRGALYAGLEGFINTRCYIFVGYKEIGELFPLITG